MFNNLFTLVPDIGKAAETLGVVPDFCHIFGRPAWRKVLAFATGVVETGVVL